MTVNTKGVVVTPVKDVLLVCGIVEHTLNKVIARARQEAFPDVRGLAVHHNEAVLARFRSVSMRIAHGASHVIFMFRYAGEDRELSFFFDADTDNRRLGPSSLCFSLGCWGEAELLTEAVLEALSMLGEPYIDRNDSDAIELAPYAGQRLNVLAALSAGYVSAYQAERIIERHAPVAPGPRTDFIGLDAAKYSKLMSDEPDPGLRWNTLRNIAEGRFPCQEHKSSLLASVSA